MRRPNIVSSIFQLDPALRNECWCSRLRIRRLRWSSLLEVTAGCRYLNRAHSRGVRVTSLSAAGSCSARRDSRLSWSTRRLIGKLHRSSSGFRQTPEHVADIGAVIAWARQQAKIPVWLIGTSRGTQSAAFVATELDALHGPDGLVLTSTVLSDDKGRPVPAMAIDKLRIPVLAVHHEHDGCRLCSFREMPALMNKLGASPRKQLLSFTGGEDRGDPCEAAGYHGFNGIEREVVAQIARWILAK